MNCRAVSKVALWYVIKIDLHIIYREVAHFLFNQARHKYWELFNSSQYIAIVAKQVRWSSNQHFVRSDTHPKEIEYLIVNAFLKELLKRIHCLFTFGGVYGSLQIYKKVTSLRVFKYLKYTYNPWVDLLNDTKFKVYWHIKIWAIRGS